MMRGWGSLAVAALAGIFTLAAAKPAHAVGGVTFGMTKTQLFDVGSGIEYGLPVIALGITALHDDWTGAAQWGVLTVATVGITYGIRDFVKKRAPDGSSDRSFPSIPASIGSPAEHYLWGRYGWQYGVPAFFLEHLGNYWIDRAGKHKITDSLAVTAYSTALNWFITTRYHRPIEIGAGAAADGTPMVTLRMALN